MEHVIEDAVSLLDTYESIHSLRLMPCPGPSPDDHFFGSTAWKVLSFTNNQYVFTYQATLWRREPYERFMNSIFSLVPTDASDSKKLNLAIHTNLAEIKEGQIVLQLQGGLHLAWPREGPQPNAVYLAPWPYRPTAIIKGKLMEWVEDFAAREGLSLFPSLR
jgi:hypothetical protein